MTSSADERSEALMEREERPPSPCTKVCTLDAQGYCAGCLRTAAEIGDWISMSPTQQWQLIEELARRRERACRERARRERARRERGAL
jgi:predicted Fe-S protein YdhL (DUF1289 family)